MALNISDPALAQAYKDVSEVKSPLNWLLFSVEGKDLKLAGTGSGGYNELISKFESSKVHFGILKVVGKDVRKNVESLRNKIVFFTYIGDGVGALAKARVSIMRPDVDKIITSYACRFDLTGELQGFSKNGIAKEMLKCGGAHTPTHYVFGPEESDMIEATGDLTN